MAIETYVYKNICKRLLAFLFDSVGKLLFFWLPRSFTVRPEKIKKVLTARIDHLGDALLLRPALLKLRQCCPDFEIHFLTTPQNAPVFTLDAFIDRILIFEKHWYSTSIALIEKVVGFFELVARFRQAQYDVAIDFRGDLRMNLAFFLAGIPVRCGYGITGGGWMLTHEYKTTPPAHQVILNERMLANIFSIPGETDLIVNPPVRYPQSVPRVLTQMISAFSTDMFAVFHAGSGNPDKEWPWNCFMDLAGKILRESKVKTLFLIGTESERRRKGECCIEGVVDLRGQTDLHELACLLSRADFFVGNDSGPAHLAAAQGIPIVLIASGTNQIEFWHPWSSCMTIVPSSSQCPATVEAVLGKLDELLVKRADK